MPNVIFDVARDVSDLEAILELQRQNVESALSTDAVERDGFVTVRHDLSVLSDMQAAEPQVVARQDGVVRAYALVMPRSFEVRLPILKDMFVRMRTLSYRGRPMEDARFFVMGQVCVHPDLRGQGVFAGMYWYMANQYRDRYDFTATEVAYRNGRSRRAHEKVGFELLLRYPDDSGEVWDLIVWDWSNPGA